MSRTQPQSDVETPLLKVSGNVREVQIHLIILGLVLVVGLALSWRCWPDPIIDFGHELYIPWRMSLGDVPYRDIELVTGPASQLYHATLFSLFGSSFTVLIVSNLVWLGLLTVSLYSALASLTFRWVAFVATLFFAIVFPFGQYTAIGNYNYLSPYRHEITHGLIAGIIGMWAISRLDHSAKPRLYFLAGLCAGATILMKTEVSLPLLGACAWWGLTGLLTNRVSIPVRGKFALSAGFVFPLAICWLELQRRGLAPGRAFVELFASWNFSLRPELTRGAQFYALVGGWNHFSENSLEIATALVVAGIVLALIAWCDKSITRSSLPKVVRTVALILVGSVALAIGVQMQFWKKIIPTLPAVLATLIAISIFRLYRLRRSVVQKSGPHFESQIDRRRGWGLWGTFALLCSLKMLFLLRIPHYGFALAMPATMVGILILLDLLPESLGLLSPPAPEASRSPQPLIPGGRLWRTFSICLLAGGMLCHFASSLGAWATRQVSIGTEGDSFWGEGFRDRRIIAIKSAYEYLHREMGAEETLAVIPDGTMLNYLLRKRNPTPYLLVGPWDIRASGGDEVVTAGFQKSPPDWIVVTSDDVSPHGTGPFGSPDYGEKLAAWIRENYSNAVEVAEPSQTFGGYSLSILKRHPNPSR